MVAAAAAGSVAERGRFILALSGGDTPRATYRRLAQGGLRDEISWCDVLVIWTDERCVPPHDPGSNYRMARETLLDHVPIPADNILRIRGEDCALAEDQRYERALHRLLAERGGAAIDMMLLGVGSDGHTASLFPRSPALAERRRWVLPALGPEPYPHRITLTLPIINASRRIVVLATGQAKAGIVQAVREGRPDPTWPISHVGGDSTPLWLVDSEACP